MLFRIFIILLFTSQVYAYDCKNPTTIQDAKYFNLCTKNCEIDKDCEIVTYGCDRYSINGQQKTLFLNFLKTFPENICDFAKNNKCFSAKCKANTCIQEEYKCDAATNFKSSPETFQSIRPMIYSGSSPNSNAMLTSDSATTLIKSIAETIDLFSKNKQKSDSDIFITTRCASLKNKLSEIVLTEDVKMNQAVFDKYFKKYPEDNLCNLYILFLIKKNDPTLSSINGDFFHEMVTNSIKQLPGKDLVTLTDFLAPGARNLYSPSNRKPFQLNYKEESDSEKAIATFSIERVLNKNLASNTKSQGLDEAQFFYTQIFIQHHPLLAFLTKNEVIDQFAYVFLALNTQKKINLSDDIIEGTINENNIQMPHINLIGLFANDILTENISAIISSKKISDSLKCSYLGAIRQSYKDFFTPKLQDQLSKINFVKINCPIEFSSFNSFIKTKKIGDCTSSLLSSSLSPGPNDFNKSSLAYFPAKRDQCVSKCTTDEECTNLTANSCYVFPGNKKYIKEYASFFKTANSDRACFNQSKTLSDFKCHIGQCIQRPLKNKQELSNYFIELLKVIKSDKQLSYCKKQYDCTQYSLLVNVENDSRAIELNIGLTDSRESKALIKELASNVQLKGVNAYTAGVDPSKSPNGNQCEENSCAYLNIKD